MAVYEYQNARGEKREIIAPMRSAPPMSVQFLEDGTWVEATEPDADGTFNRVLFVPVGGVIDRQGGVKYRGQAIPVSQSLPPDDPDRPSVADRLDGHPVKRNADGTYRTLDDRPIIRNREDRKRYCDALGYTPRD
jgi:hypothetical protein